MLYINTISILGRELRRDSPISIQCICCCHRTFYLLNFPKDVVPVPCVARPVLCMPLHGACNYYKCLLLLMLCTEEAGYVRPSNHLVLGEFLLVVVNHYITPSLKFFSYVI